MNDVLVGQQTNEEYKVCFQGASLDVGNQGCCALAASFIKLVIDTKPNAKIYLLYGNRTNGVQKLKVSGKTIELDIVNFRLSPKAKIREHLFWILFLALIQKILPIKSLRDRIVKSNRWLRTLCCADFVGEIRGGDSFSDIYGLRKFLLGIIPSIIAILMRKELVLLPQTYGPFKSRISRASARFILLRAHQIFARDMESIELVQKLLGDRDKDKIVKFCPDIAFTLESAAPEMPDIQPKLDRNSSTPLLGLNISGLLYMGGFTRNNMFGLSVDYRHFVHVLLEELMKQTNAHLLLIPHVFFGNKEGDELEICRKLVKSIDSQYADRIHLVNRQYDQNQVKGIIGLCDFFVGSRMHACIAALSQYIPIVGLAYSKKFRGVFQSVGAEQFAVDMRQRNCEEIIETIVRYFEQKDAITENIKATIPETQKLIRNVFREMLCETDD